MFRSSSRVARPIAACVSKSNATRAVGGFTLPNCGNITQFQKGGLVLRVAVARMASTTVKVPPMAESLTEGSLKEYTKQVGEFIKQDELLATIETDKIDVEVNAPTSGKVTKLA